VRDFKKFNFISVNSLRNALEYGTADLEVSQTTQQFDLSANEEYVLHEIFCDWPLS
jgi:hypothetical protein